MTRDQLIAFAFLFSGLAILGALAIADRYRAARNAIDTALAAVAEEPQITDRDLHRLIDAYNTQHPRRAGEDNK